MMETESISKKLISNYFASLVNGFFKILPMRESNEPSLSKYVEGLMAEMRGVGKLIEVIDYDARFLSLLGILQNMIDNPNYPVKSTKHDVFKAIVICKSLQEKYGEDE